MANQQENFGPEWNPDAFPVAQLGAAPGANNLPPPPPIQAQQALGNWPPVAGAGGPPLGPQAAMGAQFPHQMNAAQAQAVFGGVAQALQFGNNNNNNGANANPLAGTPYAPAFGPNIEMRQLPDEAQNEIMMEAIPDGTLMVDFRTADGAQMESNFGRFYKLSTFLQMPGFANGFKRHPHNPEFAIPVASIVVYRKGVPGPLQGAANNGHAQNMNNNNNNNNINNNNVNMAGAGKKRRRRMTKHRRRSHRRRSHRRRR